MTQCLTCRLVEKDEIASKNIDTLLAAGATYVDISEYISNAFKHGDGSPVVISPDAVSNHCRRHIPARTVQKAKKGGITTSEASEVLLGVVRPPKGWEPGFTLDGDTGEATSTPQQNDKISDFSDILLEIGLDPEEFEVAGPARVSKWQTYGGEWLTSYRVNVIRSAKVLDISDILDIVRDVTPKLPVTSGDHAFVFAAGDLQLGKSDGDGVEGTVRRYRASLQKAVDKVYKHRAEIGPILISFVGDCIEGMVSQKGKNARRTSLTTTQQVHLLRRLMIETIKAFAPLTDKLMVVSVPGNHDEAQREPVSTDGSDSWAVDALRAVAQGLAFNPEAFGHVTCEEVTFDELTKVVEVAGTKIGHAHGHQWSKGKHWDWWSGQHWGGHSIGEADVLLCGHFHTGMYEQENFKHIIRTPAFEQESTYFRHRTGKVGNPSAVSFLTKGGKLKYLDFE